MPTEPTPDMLATFGSLAEIVYTGESYESVSEAICRAAVAGKPSWPPPAPAWPAG